ncbi:hypothetical protein POM88_049581 [Heracleum sosnowskyi]|uniref:Reverse transcriptase zinc-binding domain-containing protein n=1 Tax=Heracleum sosnowskyi TaxID=360622 RepID=A0AAD8LZM1_9APIA|nr:hypothetical protein POM88_049581 [Heracleum sosnowskyi]
MVVKDTSFWQVSQPRNCSWILKKVLACRDIVRSHFSYVIGNGRNVSFWFDPWFNGEPICTSKLDRFISQSGLACNTKVAALLSSSGWVLPRSNYHTMLVWKQNFSLSHPLDLNKQDDIRWDSKPSKQLRVTDFWEAIRHRASVLPWTPSVWHRLHVPRYSCHH